VCTCVRACVCEYFLCVCRKQVSKQFLRVCAIVFVFTFVCMRVNACMHACILNMYVCMSVCFFAFVCMCVVYVCVSVLPDFCQVAPRVCVSHYPTLKLGATKLFLDLLYPCTCICIYIDTYVYMYAHTCISYIYTCVCI